MQGSDNVPTSAADEGMASCEIWSSGSKGLQPARLHTRSDTARSNDSLPRTDRWGTVAILLWASAFGNHHRIARFSRGLVRAAERRKRICKSTESSPGSVDFRKGPPKRLRRVSRVGITNG